MLKQVVGVIVESPRFTPEGIEFEYRPGFVEPDDLEELEKLKTGNLEEDDKFNLVKKFLLNIHGGIVNAYSDKEYAIEDLDDCPYIEVYVNRQF